MLSACLMARAFRTGLLGSLVRLRGTSCRLSLLKRLVSDGSNDQIDKLFSGGPHSARVSHRCHQQRILARREIAKRPYAQPSMQK